MASFPSYSGKLPSCLNPIDPRHYFLLLYWIFFRPTALKCYLYQAKPELYKSSSRVNIFQRFKKSKAYRNLYLSVPGTILLGTVLLVMLSGLIIGLVQDKPFESLSSHLQSWSNGILPTILLSVIFVIVFSVLLNIVFGSLVFSAAFSITFIIAFSLVFVLFGVVWETAELAKVDSVIVEGLQMMSVGMILGIAFNAGVNVAIGTTFSGVISAVCFVGMVVFGTVFKMPSSIPLGVGVSFGIHRTYFFPFQFLIALFSPFSKKIKHPILWDELIVLPLPFTKKTIWQRLEYYSPNKLKFISDLLSNPFQRWAVQKAVLRYLCSPKNQSQSLNFFYALLRDDSLNSYVIAPLIPSQWNNIPTARQELFDLLKKSQSNFLGDRKPTFWRDLAKLYCALLDRKIVNHDKFHLGQYKWRNVLEKLPDYSGGIEIKRFFDKMKLFLSYKQLSKFSDNLDEENSQGGKSLVNEQIFIPVEVLNAIENLEVAKAEVVKYLNASSDKNKKDPLTRAINTLKDLEANVDTVNAEAVPEINLIKRIIVQWNQLIIKQGAELAQVPETKPISNPYVAGNPVRGDLFVGREDIMTKLKNKWIERNQLASVVLFGHRRMGKSSILLNLNTCLSSDVSIIVAYFSMHSTSNIKNANGLLYNLSDAIYKSIPATHQQRLGKPEQQRFFQGDPQKVFSEFVLEKLGKILEEHEQKLIVAIDEFEVIEDLIDENKLSKSLLEFWRSLIQTHTYFILIFAGLYTLEEMTKDYWSPFYGSVDKIQVSFLDYDDSKKLITNPTTDFDADYDPETVEEIYELTHGQPYLIQLICSNLVDFVNDRISEGRERRFTRSDLIAVLDTKEFWLNGDAYFGGVWGQAKKSGPEGQTAILKELVHGDLLSHEIVEKTGLTDTQVKESLDTLIKHDVIAEQNNKYSYNVELMRRWVKEKKILDI